MTFQTNSRLVRALAGVVATMLFLGAAPAQAEFMGGGYIHAIQGCQTAGFPTGTQMVRARYSAVETDGVNAVVLNFAVGGVNTYTIAGSGLAPSRGFRRASGTATWGAQYVMHPAPTIRVIERETVVPMARAASSAVTGSTRMVRLHLQIRNFNGVRGCIVDTVLNLARWN